MTQDLSSPPGPPAGDPGADPGDVPAESAADRKHGTDWVVFGVGAGLAVIFVAWGSSAPRA